MRVQTVRGGVAAHSVGSSKPCWRNSSATRSRSRLSAQRRNSGGGSDWTLQLRLIVRPCFTIRCHKWFIQTRIALIAALHYAVTQTGLFALPLQIRRTCMTSAGGGGVDVGGGVARRSSCEAERGSIAGGERAGLCNDDAYQCPGCKSSLLIVFLCTSDVRSRLHLQGLHSRVGGRSNIRHR